MIFIYAVRVCVSLTAGDSHEFIWCKRKSFARLMEKIDLRKLGPDVEDTSPPTNHGPRDVFVIHVLESTHFAHGGPGGLKLGSSRAAPGGKGGIVGKPALLEDDRFRTISLLFCRDRAHHSSGPIFVMRRSRPYHDYPAP